MVGLLGRATCPVVLARGEHDQMVSDADLRALVREPVTLEGLGRNAHVEDPAAVSIWCARSPDHVTSASRTWPVRLGWK
jgi:pimeloyl-ACP methyl ester carboxylesterase